MVLYNHLFALTHWNNTHKATHQQVNANKIQYLHFSCIKNIQCFIVPSKIIHTVSFLCLARRSNTHVCLRKLTHMTVSWNTEVNYIYIILQQCDIHSIIFESYHGQSGKNAGMQWEERQTWKGQICIHLTAIAGVWISMDMYSEVSMDTKWWHLWNQVLGLGRHYFFRGGWLLGLP